MPTASRFPRLSPGKLWESVQRILDAWEGRKGHGVPLHLRGVDADMFRVEDDDDFTHFRVDTENYRVISRDAFYANTVIKEGSTQQTLGRNDNRQPASGIGLTRIYAASDTTDDDTGGASIDLWGSQFSAGREGTVSIHAFGQGSGTANAVRFYTRSGVDTEAERVRIFGSGGVYIGDTPSDPGANNLTVQGNLVITGLVTAGSGTGVTDHGALTGLSDDDHNIYHTDARALTWLGTRSTTDLPEGANLYYTQTRFNTAFAAKDTGDLAEGVNLYYTDARARAALSAGTGISYNSGTGVITATGGVTAPLTLTLNDATANDVSTVLTLVHTTSGGGGTFSPDTGGSLPTDLQAYWDLDEASGDVTDSITSLVGTNSGTVSTTGKVGNARTFSGAEYITVAQTTALDQKNNWSIALWAKPTNLSVIQTLVTKGTATASASHQYLLYINANANGDVMFATATENVYTAGGVLTINVWNHIVVTCSGGNTYKIYVNGVDQSLSGSISAITSAITDSWVIGRHSAGTGRYFTGDVDELGLWDKTLSSTEVGDLYNSGSGNTYTLSGVGQTGIGAGLLFQAEDDAGGTENVAQIAGLLTNAANAAEASALTFSTRTSGGALTEHVRIAGNGAVTLNGPLTVIRSDASSSGVFATLRNTSTGSSAGIAQSFELTESNGTTQQIAGQIRVVKTSAWTSGDSATLDGSMSFLVLENGSLTSWLNFSAASGTVTMQYPLAMNANVTLGEGANIVTGTTTGTKIGTSASQKIGFHNVTPVAQETVTGSRGGNAALADLLTKLATKGLIVDGTSA